MKKLLSIVIFVLFGVTSVWAQNLIATTQLYVSPNGGGKVLATTSSSYPASGWLEQDADQITLKNQPDKTNGCGFLNSSCSYEWYGYSLYYHAKADEGYTFMGWSNDNDNSIESSSSRTLDLSVSTNTTYSQNGKRGLTWSKPDKDLGNLAKKYAVFKKIILPNTNNFPWTLYSDPTPRIEVVLTKAKDVSIIIKNTKGTSGVVSVAEDYSAVTTTDGLRTGSLYLTLSADANVADGDTYEITITETSNGGLEKIDVTILNSISITLACPTIGEGCVQAEPVLGGDVEEVCYNSSKDNTFELSDSKLFDLKLTPIPAAGYDFLRWKINGEYKEIDADNTYFASHQDVITAEFVPVGTAFFVVVKYDSNGTAISNGKEYFSLKDAIAVASTTDYTTIVVKNDGILYNKDFDIATDGKMKEITIPSGVTFLVPGNEKYTKRTNLVKADLVETNTTPKRYRLLTLPSDTRINANGNICIYASVSAVKQSNGTPQSYGQIAMGDNSEIILNNGAILTAAGYITGNHTNTSVIAKSGSTIYELFQFRDWRGGTQAMSLNNNSQRVFPICQFYVQNVETKLTLEHGATEYVFTGVDVTLAGIVNLPMEMITAAETTDRGFLRLYSGATISKWYDGVRDRQCYQISKQKDHIGTATVDFGIMYADIPVAGAISSDKYVLPITSNMDVVITSGVNIINLYDLELLAGAYLELQSGASYTSQGNLFVYDKEWNIGYFSDNGQKLMPINYTAYHYDKYLSDKTTYKYLSSGKPYSAANTNIRTVENLEDAKLVVDGSIVVSTTSGVKDGSGFYTTAKHASNATDKGTSEVDADYGAKIISNGGGTVDFQQIGTKTVTYQKNGTTTVNIPVTNARLRNADGSYSAGGDKNMPEGMYRYNKNAGKWLIPNQDDIEIQTWEGNDFTVYLPNITDIEVICPITGSDIDVDKFTYEILDEERKHVANSRFAIGTPKYENGELVVPLTYTPVNVHNVNNPYKEEYLVINWSSQTEDKSCPIPLIATEDYTPKFNVEIIGNGTFEVTNLVYTFPIIPALSSSTAQVAISPDLATTAKLLSAENWNVSAIDNPPFAAALGDGEQFLSDASVSFTPQAGQKYEGSLTIKATYKDAAGEEIPSATTTVVLNGEGALQPNWLEFDPALANKTIIQGEAPIKNIFKHLGSGIDKITTMTCTYADGTDASALVAITKEADNYTLTALEPNNPAITDVREVTITVHQDPSAIMAGTGNKPVTLTVTILPPAVWNWADLYFGETYTNQPVTPSKEGEWKLELTTNPNNLLTFSGESPNYQVQVGNGDVGMVYEAEFTFTQGDYVKVFTSRLQADPRTLGYCVEYTRQFTNVSTGNSTVTFAEGHDATPPTTTFRPADIWEIMMIGIPDKLTFTASGEKIWYISESSTGAANSYTPIISGETLSGEQVLQLSPTTNYVKFEYGAGAGNNGTISNLCISAMELTADMDVLYFPIYKNGDQTSKEIVIKHSKENIDVTIQENNSGLTIVKSATIATPTADDGEAYYQTTVTLSGDKTNVSKGIYTLNVAQQGAEPINVQIHADEVPQGLPIHFETDDVHRYNFIALPEQSRHVKWDAKNRSVLFQDPGNIGITRSVVFAFEGAPSRISFISEQEIGWTIEESKTGAEESYNPCSGTYTAETKTFVYQLNYESRYVRVKYFSQGREVASISNLIIEGDPMLLVNPDELEFSDTEEERQQKLTLTTINLQRIHVKLDNDIDFDMTHGNHLIQSEYILLSTDYPDALGKNKVGNIEIDVNWTTENLANEGLITIYNILEDNSEVVLAKVKLVAAGKYIRLENAAKTGVYTGVPDGTRDLDGDGNPDTEYKYTYHGKDYNENNTSPYTYHEVNLTNAFAPDGTALFDYLFVYGETTTKEGDGSFNITAPAEEKGSNARTPLRVYARDVDADGNYDRYRHVKTIDDINVGTKPHIEGVTVSGNEESENENKEPISVPVNYIPVGEQLSVYITGFAPYATTGYTKGDEGVFFFRGEANSKLHVYLEDAHIFARNKMQNGQPFYTRGDERNPTFSEKYARGSGGVLVFECVTKAEQITLAKPFEVSIHTIGNNLLKSNYGCFNYFFGMDPFQISAPIHVRLHSADHVRLSKTTLNFDDIWPTKLDEIGQITDSKRTNGFLGLKKLNNNAPSIDLGNPYTTVNFNGGQVQLQNAQIVSTNYKTTLAISYRSGEYGGDKVGLKFAYGIGTDSVGGTVNFNDGTITIEPMWVKEEYKKYYFIDKDENGNEIKKKVGTVEDENDPTKTLDIYEYQTTCLRCPKNTYVYGGSICWLRACQHVTSKGGAPMGGKGIDVGQFIYDFKPEQGDEMNDKKLVTKLQFPNDNIINEAGKTVAAYFDDFYPNHQYGVNSITPDANNKLYFWIPEGYGGVSAEKDKFLTTWKACMTEISAGANGLEGSVGGDTPIERNEEIKYMLYCQIDPDISAVIRAGTENGNNNYTYKAPVKVPSVAQDFYQGKYAYIPPISVSEELQHKVTSEQAYEVTDKVYYITTATADVWQTFTAPFDVAKIWVVEAYSEKALENIANTNGREVALLAQAEHNADFAAFFGVAMAIGTKDPLETIFNDFVAWGKEYDQQTTDKYDQSKEAVYNSTSDGDYTLRDRYQLIPYNGSNWNKANFYLNHNAADWEIDGTDENGDPKFKVQWELPDVDDDGIPQNGVLMRKGETYSMLFPYCTGCWETEDDGEGNVTVKDREFWDYWSGKFLIFESVDYSKESDKVHIIEGSDYIKEDWTADELETIKPDGIFVTNLPAEGKAKVTGNSTFAYLDTEREDILTYFPVAAAEAFLPNLGETIYPTSSFLLAPSIPLSMHNMPARGVKRTGEIIYDQPDDDNNGNQNGTSGHMPTVGGGNDLFVTSIAGGINVAVAAPQNVRVLSSTGAVIYSGYVTTAVDIQLPTTGIYIVSGENEVQKILF